MDYWTRESIKPGDLWAHQPVLKAKARTKMGKVTVLDYKSQIFLGD